MTLDWSDGELAEGLRCYGREEFFEAHEHWEIVWLGCEAPEKLLLQALIQLTAAFHHWKRGNRRGATSLLEGALRRLEPYPEHFGGVGVAALRADARKWLEMLHGVPADLAYPRIPIDDPE